MSAQPLASVLGRLRRLVFERDTPVATDGALVRAYVEARDDVAFAELVRRHGPMVLGVCRRILGHVHDAEDAFQATFLVLARKANAVQPPDLVGNWLHGVATRTALEARSRVLRHRRHEKQVADLPHPTVEIDVETPDLKRLIDRELSRLPDKIRAAVVLCELEGWSRKDAAALLHVPEGTLSSRLAAARKLLAARLGARGITASAATLGTLFASELAQATTLPFDVHHPSTHASILAEKVMNAMLLSKIKSIASFALLICAGLVGLALIVNHTLGDEHGDAGATVLQANTQQNTQTETKQTQKNDNGVQPPANTDKLTGFSGIHVKQGVAVIRQTGRERVDWSAKAGASSPKAVVEGGVLVLQGGNPGVEFEIEVKELSRLTVDDVGKIVLLDLKGKTLEVIVNRPATVILAGNVQQQIHRLAPGATVDAISCPGEQAVVDAASGSRALVNVRDVLRVTIAAGGAVEYVGAPRIVEKISPGGALMRRAVDDAPPPQRTKATDPPDKKPSDPMNSPKGGAVLSALVDGYTQGTMFNMQKYPFKYTGAATLTAEQFQSLSKPGEVPAATAKAMLACLLWPKQDDVLQKAMLKSDGKKLNGEAEVLHKYGKQGTHVLKIKLEGKIDEGRLSLNAIAPTVTGTWDYGGGVIKLTGEVKVTISVK